MGGLGGLVGPGQTRRQQLILSATCADVAMFPALLAAAARISLKCWFPADLPLHPAPALSPAVERAKWMFGLPACLEL